MEAGQRLVDALADDIAELIALVAAPGSTNIHGAIFSSDRGVTAG
jgi:hypothetical protein